VGRDPLEQGGGRKLERNTVRDRNEVVAIRGHALGVAVGNVHPGHAFIGPDDLARAFDADDRRRLLAVVAALALIHVSEVDADRLDVDHDLAGARGGIRHLFVLEHLGPPVPLENYCAHQVDPPT